MTYDHPRPPVRVHIWRNRITGTLWVVRTHDRVTIRAFDTLPAVRRWCAEHGAILDETGA